MIGGAVTSSWRYARAVKTEVEYGDPQCAAFKPGICNGHYSEIPAADAIASIPTFEANALSGHNNADGGNSQSEFLLEGRDSAGACDPAMRSMTEAALAI